MTRSQDLRGFWKEENSNYSPAEVKTKKVPVSSKPKKRKSRQKPKQKRKPNKYREFALKSLGRKPAATDNVLLHILICEEMGWEQGTNRDEIMEIIRRYYHMSDIISGHARVKAKSDDDFYSSKAWKTLRYQALKNNGGSCECCGARASDGVSLHVDHIKPRSRYPGLELDLSNMQILCQDCNIGKDNWDETDWRQEPHQGTDH